MTEDTAATVWLAMQIGTPEEIADEDVEEITRPLYECVRAVKVDDEKGRGEFK